MTVPEILTLLTAGTAAVVTIINALRGRATRQQVHETYIQVGALGGQLNGRLAELLDATRDAAWDAGLREGHRLALAAHRRPPVQAPEENVRA